MCANSSTKKICSLIMFSLFLAGCESVPYIPPDPVLPLAPSASRLIFFRPSAFVSEGRVPDISIDGLSFSGCVLKNGGAFAKDVSPGVTEVSATINGSLLPWGTSKISFNVTAGKTYYVELTPNDGAIFAPTLAFELLSQQQSGPFYISLSDKSALGDIKPVGCNI